MFSHGAAQIRLDCCPNAQQDKRKCLNPSCVSVNVETSFKQLVVMLHYPIRRRMIRCHSDAFTAEHLRECLKKGRLKLMTSICCDSRKHSKIHHPLCNENTSFGLHCDISKCVHLSTQVSIYICTSDGGRGPTMSVCT